MEQWVLFLGRFHPLLIHLPIGILVALVVLEFIPQIRKNTSDNSRNFLLGIVFVGAILSVLTGLMLEREGGYSEDRVRSHMILGIAMTVCLGIALLIRLRFHSHEKSTLAYKLALGVSTLLMTAGSHQGGILTHGRFFLTEHFPFSAKEAIEEAKAEMVVPEDGQISYQLHVKPLLETHCIECHNAEKMKVDLRLDSHEAIMKGSKFDSVVIPGDPEESTLYYLTTFPEDDPDRMPKDGDPLTDEQISILREWIAQGAKF
jgi:uncharacterized membrane protein